MNKKLQADISNLIKCEFVARTLISHQETFH